MLRSLRLFPPTLFVLSLIGSCGKGDSLVLPSEGQAAKITLVRGDGQSGRVGEPLTDPVVVQVMDSKDRPVEGAEVSFELTSSAQGADLVPKTSTTDADGMANTRVVLGTTIGPQTGQAQVVMSPGVLSPSTTFTVMALPENANGIAAVEGQDQSGHAGATLDHELVVEVTDAFGNPISGAPITWTAVGGGSVSATSSTTDDQGHASVRRVLGNTVGIETTLATSEGLAGSPVTFVHTVLPGSAASVVIVSGDNQTGPAGSRLAGDLIVQVLDASGNPVPNAAVTWVVAVGGGSVTPENSTTDANGHATTQWTLGQTPGEGRVDAVVSGVGVVSFKATVPAPPNQAPAAAFTANCIQLACSFNSDSSRDPDGKLTSWLWDFGDGSKSDVKNPSHTYASGGTYNVTLTVTDNAGATNAVTHPMTVSAPPPPPPPQNQAPSAGFTSNCTNLGCSFTDQSTDDKAVTGWSWTFGDPTSPDNTSTEKNPNHTFTRAGTYSVSLTVRDAEGLTSTKANTVTVSAPPSPPGTTVTTITGDEPDPSLEGAIITVSFTVTSSAGDPTGDVQVTEAGGGSCTATVAQGSCKLAPVGLGERTITANYLGTPKFSPSSGTAQHTVNAPAPPPNQTPTANPDQAVTTEDTPVRIDVLANDVDPDRDSLTARVVSGPASGTAAVDAGGTITYTPTANFSGTDSLTYTATDPSGASSTATVTITVNPVNDAPSFQIGAKKVSADPSDGPQTIESLATDISAGPGEMQTVAFTTTADRPDFFTNEPAIDPTGTLTFTPAANATGDTVVTVTLRDDAGGVSDPQTFSMEFKQKGKE
jgi:PKD repeat protein